MAKPIRYFFKAVVSLVLAFIMALSLSVSVFASAATDRIKQQYGFAIQISDTSRFNEDFAVKLIDKSFAKLPQGFVKALTEQERILSDYNNIIIFDRPTAEDGDSLGYINSSDNGDYYIKILTTEDTGTLTHEFGHYFSNYLTETITTDTERQWTALNGGEQYIGENWVDLDELTGNAARTFVTTYGASEFAEDFGEIFRVLYYNTDELQPFLADSSSPIAKKVDFMKKLVADTVNKLSNAPKATPEAPKPTPEPVNATPTPATASTVSATADAKPASATVVIDGKQVNFEAYNIDGNNYFKIRELAECIDFAIGYDQKTNTVTIDTTMGF